MKYQAMSETVLKAVGGKENITSVTHCATRLRIDARDTSIIDLQPPNRPTRRSGQ